MAKVMCWSQMGMVRNDGVGSAARTPRECRCLRSAIHTGHMDWRSVTVSAALTKLVSAHAALRRKESL
eukprot:2816963-Amphidinium_carterae.2